MNQYAVIDGFGIYGNLLHYALVISLVGGAFIIFLYLWKTDRLSMDEEAKYQMMDEEQELNSKEKKNGVRSKSLGRKRNLS
ncbi:unnamed protein product [Candidatus Protochlamydia amoebophila UWE25]|uniref:Uncharacterized protein n=1 Tax=Protochlamydia amoebophila (strain UWE25) TaxID=264201 RepID=A0A2P9HAI3_PARUW|nr:unnamed protein product [Candidatus Protochlamydia amoebophila UWE25]